MSNRRYQAMHDCGGTVLLGVTGDDESRHIYCDRCLAFTYDTDADLPRGTDKEENRAAWDAGDDESPDA